MKIKRLLKHNKYNKLWRENNPEKANEIKKRFDEKHLGYHKQYQKQWRKDNSEKVEVIEKRFNKKYPEYFEEYYQKNREKLLEKSKVYNRNNNSKVRKYKRQYSSIKNKIDLKYNLNHRMSTAIDYSLKNNKNGRKWETLVGYTLNDLINRFKKTIPKGYIWQDYIDGKLEIDHIIPISVFNFTKPEHIDFKKCWALENLQLLPARENIIKSNKLTKSFQPALKIF